MTAANELLERFRAAVARLDPTRPVVDAKWHVDRPGTSAANMAAPLQLEPSSIHLVVGAIGCGKSTEMLAVERILLATAGVQALYVDVSMRAGWGKEPGDGVLQALGQEMEARFADKMLDLPDSHKSWVQLERTLQSISRSFDPASGIHHLSSQKKLPNNLVLLIDGMDRLAPISLFDIAVRRVVDTLQSCGVGALFVGPWRLLAGTERVQTERTFDTVHELSPVPVSDSADGRQFLADILKARQVDGFFDPPAIEHMIALSGGIPRDLMHLAKAGVHAAWAAGGRLCRAQDIEAAADRMGREMVLGLTPDEIELLRAVHKTGQFVPITDEQRALVPTKRVLQYRDANGLPFFTVHPTIVPLLGAIRP